MGSKSSVITIINLFFLVFITLSFSGCGGSLEGTNTNSGVTVSGKIFNTSAEQIKVTTSDGQETEVDKNGEFQFENVDRSNLTLAFDVNGTKSLVDVGVISPNVSFLELEFTLKEDKTVVASNIDQPAKSSKNKNSDPITNSKPKNQSASNEATNAGSDSKGDDKGKSDDKQPDAPTTEDPADSELPTLPIMQLFQFEQPESLSDENLSIGNNGIVSYQTKEGALNAIISESNQTKAIAEGVATFATDSQGNIMYVSNDLSLSYYTAEKELTKKFSFTLAELPQRIAISNDATILWTLYFNLKGSASVAKINLENGKEEFRISPQFLAPQEFTPQLLVSSSGEYALYGDGSQMTLITSKGESFPVLFQGAAVVSKSIIAVTDSGSVIFISQDQFRRLNPRGVMQIMIAVFDPKQSDSFDYLKVGRNSSGLDFGGTSYDPITNSIALSAPSSYFDGETKKNTQYFNYDISSNTLTRVTNYLPGYNVPVNSVRSRDGKYALWIENYTTARAAAAKMVGLMVLKVPATPQPSAEVQPVAESN